MLREIATCAEHVHVQITTGVFDTYNMMQKSQRRYTGNNTSWNTWYKTIWG